MQGEASVRAIGMMSGTSLDGIDAALIETDGIDILHLGETAFAAYPDALRERIRARFGSWQGAEGLDALAKEITQAHGALLQALPEAALLGFHGQTLNHDPAAGRTHQIGDGQLLARASGLPVVWDFRSADIASGGEGAPLVPVFHHALARLKAFEEPVAFVNIGGVANVTWVDPRQADPAAPLALAAFDTGPGNALMDDLMRARSGAGFDAGGAEALRGARDDRMIARWLEDPYFAQPAPKSLDRQHFHPVLEDLAGKDLPDALATLAGFTAAAIMAGVRHMPEPPARWLICGGGRRNGAVMRDLASQANRPVDPVEAVGLDGDFLEAQAFGYLAVRVVRGLPTSLPATTGARLPVCGGRISCPRGDTS